MISRILTCLGMLLIMAACQTGPLATAHPPIPSSVIITTLPVPSVTSMPEPYPSVTVIPTSTTTRNYPPLILSDTPTPASTPTFNNDYPPSATLAIPLVERIPFNPQPALPPGLSVTIYRMNQPVHSPWVGYMQVQAELKEDSRWVTQNLNQTNYMANLLKANNVALAPFGYQIQPDPRNSQTFNKYVLYQGGQVLVENIDFISPVSVNSSKTDFILFIEAPGGDRLVHSHSIEMLNNRMVVFGTSPQFLGDDVIAAWMEPEQGKLVVNVYRNNLLIYTTSSEVVHVRPQLYGLWTYGNHWAVEVLDGISIDSQSMNQLHNYQKSYQFTNLAGKTLFFFEREGQVGLNFNGQEVMLGGQTIPHYNCCEGTMINPQKAGNMLIFFMQSGEQWFYVEVEIKE